MSIRSLSGILVVGAILVLPGRADAGILKKAGKAVGGFIGDRKNDVTNVGKAVTGAVRTGKDAVTGAVRDAKDEVKKGAGLVAKIPGFLGDRARDAAQIGDNAVQGALQLARNVGASVVDKGLAGVQIVASAAGGVLKPGAVAATLGFWGPIALVSEAGKAVINAAKEFGEGVGEGYEQATSGQGDAFVGRSEVSDGGSDASATGTVEATGDDSGSLVPDDTESTDSSATQDVESADSSTGQEDGSGDSTPQTDPGSAGTVPSDGYVIRRGDTLSQIAGVLQDAMTSPPPVPPIYGPGGLVEVLARANVDTISDPNLIFTGNILRIPTEAELRGRWN